jgi:hypothetical protein
MAGNMVALRQSLHVVLKRPEANPAVAPRAFVGDGAGESARNRVKAGDTALYEIILEEALLDLPERYRTVVMLRDIEELSTSETAAVLDLTEHNIKVRLDLCRAMARGWLLARVGANAKRAFPFMGVRCDRVPCSERLAKLTTGQPLLQ